MASSSLSLSALSLFIVLLLSLLISPSQSQTCSSQSFTNKTFYTHCNDLPSLNSFLHYTYNPAQSTLSLVFIAPPAKPDGWIAWSINPTATGMIGAQTLVAFKLATGEMAVKTYNITAYAPLKESKVWFKVKDSKAESSGGVIRLFATLVLPEEHKTTLNHVWQVGAAVDNGVPAKHEFQPANLNAKGTLDLLKGESSGATGVDSKTKKKNIHGILNGLSWGILFPLGIIIARYLRTFPSADPAWFYLHVTCQVSAYILGVAGWGTGLKLGSLSKGVTYTYHRGIGIALFCLATIQISALLLRPNKEHKYRIYWNIYHHGIGYSIVILGIINVFKGLDILMPAKKWKSGYIIVLAILGGVALLLEVITWIIVLKRRARKASTKPYDGFNNGD